MSVGRIHSIESLGSLDGPGIRTVFFMQGCNMQCLYCHNRDSWDCSGGKSISTDEIVRSTLSYCDYYGGRGGVTFSGGEPLLQSDFLIEVVGELKKRGIHTALDTSGSIFSESSRRLIELVDLVILDIKHSDIGQYEELCRYSGSNTFKTLEFLQNGHSPYWIRQVILKGYTASISQVDKLQQIVSRGLFPEKVELLPYHKMGLEKWTALNCESPLQGIDPPSEDLMSQLNTRLYNSFTVSKK